MINQSADTGWARLSGRRGREQPQEAKLQVLIEHRFKPAQCSLSDSCILAVLINTAGKATHLLCSSDSMLVRRAQICPAAESPALPDADLACMPPAGGSVAHW